jgi:hypothetical protein
MSTAFDYSLGAILPVVRESLHDMTSFAFSRYVDGVCIILERRQVPDIRNRPQGVAFIGYSYDIASIPAKLRDLISEAFYYLIQVGFVVPQPPESHFQTSSEYLITARGQEWAKGGGPLPEDFDGYMKLLRTLVPKLDFVIEQYVSEGLTSFVRGNYFAAAVMIGAASEKAIYLLATSMPKALKSAQQQSELEKLLEERKLNALLKFLEKAIRNAKVIQYAVAEGSDRHLASLFESISVQRNDAVHPMNAKVSADSVRLSFSAFPHALEKVQALSNWLVANPGTI